MMAETALILVDMQLGLDDPWYGIRNNPLAEANAQRLLTHWRGAGRPVVHIQHLSTNPESPLYPGKPGVAHKPQVAPSAGEPVIQKQVNSAFIGTDLEQWLRDRDITRVVIAGLTTNHCVETTTRMSGNLGFDTYLAQDACAAHHLVAPDGTIYSADMVHAMSVANLASEFATVLTVDEIIAQSGGW